jgi:hypothetical protein
MLCCRFVAVMHGNAERVVPGNAVAVDAEKPFHALNRYGAAFLSKFEAAESPAPLLQYISYVLCYTHPPTNTTFGPPPPSPLLLSHIH